MLRTAMADDLEGFGEVRQNFSGSDVSSTLDPNYQFLTDIWVGIVLTLMVLSCVCCMCSCVLYHKFQQWKMSALEARNQANIEAPPIEAELPSYTIASGLPTYQEALEQLKKVRELTKNPQKHPELSEDVPKATLSVATLFQLYNKGPIPGVKPS